MTSMQTRVRFKDGTEITRDWDGEPGTWSDGTPMTSAPLDAAIAMARIGRGWEEHDGAWLESTSGD